MRAMTALHRAARDDLADKASFGKGPEEETLLLYAGHTFQAEGIMG